MELYDHTLDIEIVVVIVEAVLSGERQPLPAAIVIGEKALVSGHFG
jgi:hypothetical protein